MRSRQNLVLWLLVFSLPVLAARAQDKEPCRSFLIPDYIANAKAAYPQDRDKALAHLQRDIFDPANDRGCQALMLASVYPTATAKAAYKAAFHQYKNVTENVTQVGSGSSAGGTTNLVSKNLSSEVLSVASEYGGVTQSSSGQTTTFSGTLASVPLSVESRTGTPLFGLCSAGYTHCIRPETLDRLGRFSYGVGVGTGGGSAGSGTASAASGSAQSVSLSSAGSSSAYSLSQVTGKFAFLRQLPTASALAAAAKNIDATIEQQTETQANKLTALLASIDQSKGAAVQANLEQAAQALFDGFATDPETAWNTAALRLTLAAKAVNPGYLDQVAAYLQAIAEYSAQEEMAYSGALKPTLSFEYDFNLPTQQPTNSVFKVVASWILTKSANTATPRKVANKTADPPDAPSPRSPASPTSTKTNTTTGWTLTLNAASSIYNTQPSASIPTARRLRDIQIAGEADYKFPKSLPVLGAPTFCGAFYYQDQTSAAILNVPITGLPITGLATGTKQVFTRTGPIDVGQFKLSFGSSSSSGIRVPLAFTVANRTELLQGMDVKGQIGISYDFDSLLSK